MAARIVRILCRFTAAVVVLVVAGMAVGITAGADEAATFTVTGLPVQEGRRDARFLVQLSSGSGIGPHTVDFTTTPGTASDVDFQMTKGSLVFDRGDRTEIVAVPLFDDLLAEGDETFRLVLSNPSVGTIATGDGSTLTIRDDEPALPPDSTTTTTAPPTTTSTTAPPTTTSTTEPTTTTTAPPAGADLGGRFIPLNPSRIFDSRRSKALTAGETRVIQVAGRGGVPTSGVMAVVLNTTTTDSTATSYLSVTPSGGNTISNLNWRAGRTRANQVTVPLGPDGAIRAYNNNGTVQVIMDVAGYYTAPNGGAGAEYTGLAPARLQDTRTAAYGRPAGRLNAPATLLVDVTGGALPNAGVDAVVLNLTALGGTEPGYLAATPDGSTGTSSLNYAATEVVANLVTVPVGPDGMVRVQNNTGGVHVIVDVFGYYSSSVEGATFRAIEPSRFMDSRSGSPLGSSDTFAVGIAGRNGLPAENVTAAIMNVTAVSPTVGSYLSITPSGGNTTSNLNFSAGDVVPNQVVAATGRDGKVRVYNFDGSVDFLVDVSGYFVAG